MAWVVGGISSVAAVLLAIGFDPFGTTAAIISVLLAKSQLVFGGLSILGFTIAPNVSWLPTGEIQIAAIIFGAIVLLTFADSLWDSIERSTVGEDDR